MTRPVGSKNAKPAIEKNTTIRLPDDLKEWVDSQTGPNFSAKTIAILRAARALNIKPYYPNEVRNDQ